ncbi:MAG: hypothetical protein IM596_07885 [Pseudanabaena sp. M051S1SP2A07QC]|nr:hypothetical protein [Pseudanabaena sp. M109S1SP2A07QC]MCA6521762.1 hypothetical protein [Pseudanabaena sp. M051S1SP2A07QC]
MPETITVTKFYSNREIAEILGCTPEYIRKLKSTKKDELAGLWRNDGGGDETVWSEDGLNKLAELISTDKAKEFRAGALARRTEQAIAVDRAEISYQNDIDKSSTRTGSETTAYTINEGRYSQLPEKLGGAIVGQMVNDGAVERIDKAVISGLLRELNIGDIELQTLLS